MKPNGSLVGQKFHRLSVIKQAPPPEHLKYKKTTFWLCLCDCGNEVIVRRAALTSGTTKSCGCYKNEVNHMRRKINSYIKKIIIMKYTMKLEISFLSTLKIKKEFIIYTGRLVITGM